MSIFLQLAVNGMIADTLSGGQQPMLAIARALIQNSQLILMDEPSRGLSPKAMKEVFKKRVQINKEGSDVIIVEQNAKQAVEIADTTYVLEDGKAALKSGREITA
jgi:branched-chain amino acid transport system ATP-binding protein